MPKTFCWKCKKCGETAENSSWSNPPVCECGYQMIRDYQAESVISTFHPTVDTFANRSKPKTATKLKPNPKKKAPPKKKPQKKEGEV